MRAIASGFTCCGGSSPRPTAMPANTVPQLCPEDRHLLQSEMAARVIALQQPDGFWHSSLLDPASYPLKETSGSGFFTYALAWGVNQGLLDRAKFEPAIRKAWQALVDCVSPEGRLTNVQPVGGSPRLFDENATEVYGVGAFLLAGSEVYRMVAPRGSG